MKNVVKKFRFEAACRDVVFIRGTWVWTWGEDSDGSRVDWGVLIQWSWHQGVWKHQLEKAAYSINQTPYKDACLQWGNSEGGKVFVWFIDFLRHL